MYAILPFKWCLKLPIFWWRRGECLMPFKVSNFVTSGMQKNYCWCFTCYRWHLAVVYMAYGHIYVQVFNNKSKESNSFHPVCCLGPFFYRNNVYTVNIFLLWQTFSVWGGEKKSNKSQLQKIRIVWDTTHFMLSFEKSATFSQKTRSS